MKESGSSAPNINDATADCPFCHLPENPESPFERSSPIDDKGDVILKPDLRMLTPGWLLAITRSHYTSFSQIDHARLSEVDKRLNLYEQELSERFGRYFRIEHGSDNINTDGSGGCIEHAHMHLIPADDDVGTNVQEQLPWEQLDSYEDLAGFRGSPYIYLGRVALHYVISDPKLPGQWARRQVASARGLDNWDWTIKEADDELEKTMDGLRDFPLKIFSESK